MSEVTTPSVPNPIRIGTRGSALALAQALQSTPGVAKVIYPGLPGHPHYDLAMRQMGSGGTMIALDLGSKAAAFAALNRMALVSISNNLGDAKSIATHPATTTHKNLSDEDRAELSIGGGTMRLSVGLEDAQDLIADLDRALAAAG